MKILDTDFWETKVLPVVVAFGLGVLATSHSAVIELEARAEAYHELAQEVDAMRFACGLQPDADVIFHMAMQEVPQ
ncbi:hypothetical protein [Thauera sp.]|uniref:hypothetical protein n=1 Tax=Thauera sp. TaxID=1905334 RepID=UPI0039E25559